MDINTRLLTTCDFSREQFELEIQRLKLHYQRKSRARRLMKVLNRRRLTTERGFHACHKEPIFSTSRADQSNGCSKIPKPVSRKICNSTRLQSFEQFRGEREERCRVILAFII